MAYERTIYNNPRQINMGNLNKIENKLEELDKDVEELKGKAGVDSSANTIATINGKYGIDGKSIVSVNCVSEFITEGTKLTFTFTLSDDSKLNCDVIIPTPVTNTEIKSE
jgi:hypothetical protein